MTGARALYERFNARTVDGVIALDARIQIPAKLGAVGRALRLYYWSNKWDGKPTLYEHTYESGVDFCEPWRAGLRPVRPQRWPRALALLGICAGVEVARDDGNVRFPKLPKSTLLCGTPPDGRALFLVDPKRGVLGALLGGNQRVTNRGVVG